MIGFQKSPTPSLLSTQSHWDDGSWPFPCHELRYGAAVRALFVPILCRPPLGHALPTYLAAPSATWLPTSTQRTPLNPCHFATPARHFPTPPRDAPTQGPPRPLTAFAWHQTLPSRHRVSRRPFSWFLAHLSSQTNLPDEAAQSDIAGGLQHTQPRFTRQVGMHTTTGQPFL